MNYSHITEDISHAVRDASLDLAEERHLAIMEDPHQQWSRRLPRPTGRDNEEFIVEMLDMV